MNEINPDNFTEKSIEAINGASEIAKQRRNTEITQTHLLASLVSQDSGIVGAVIDKLVIKFFL